MKIFYQYLIFIFMLSNVGTAMDNFAEDCLEKIETTTTIGDEDREPSVIQYLENLFDRLTSGWDDSIDLVISTMDH